MESVLENVMEQVRYKLEDDTGFHFPIVQFQEHLPKKWKEILGSANVVPG